MPVQNADPSGTFDLEPQDPASLLTLGAVIVLKQNRLQTRHKLVKKFRYEVFDRIWILSFSDLMSI